MEGENLKCVFLSGTPMINDPYEVAQLFNLLRGYTPTYAFTFKALGPASAPFLNFSNDLQYLLINLLLNNVIIK